MRVMRFCRNLKRRRRKMCEKHYIVKLTQAERAPLNELGRTGKSPAKRQWKAQIWLTADESSGAPSWHDPQLAEALGPYPIMA